MLKTARYFCFLLIIALLVLTSCGNNDDSKKNIPTDDGTPQETTVNPLWGNSPVPAVFNANGKTIRVYNVSTGGSFEQAEQTGEIVDDAIYKRNQIVEDKLGVKFKHSYTPEGAESANTAFMNLINANLNEYDIATHYQYDAIRLVTQGAFKDIVDLPYIDINDPWWATNYCEEIGIGKDKMFFLTGDWNLNVLGSQSAMFVNKALYRNEIGDPDDLYQTVMDGKWTFDLFSDTVRDMWKDLDGDGRKSEPDQYGTIIISPTMANHLTFAAGVRFTERDENGLPVMIVPSERNASFAEKINQLYFKNAGTRWIDTSQTPEAYDIIRSAFSEGRMLMYVGRFWDASGPVLRAMETDYMIIPYPKLDENDIYRSLIHDGCPLLCVPSTSTLDDNTIGAVFTELAYQAHEHMIPAYFEVALKGKFVRDMNDVAYEIVDMIRANVTTDFAYIYNYSLASVGNLVHTMLGERSSRIVSLYGKIESAVEAGLQELIDAYLY